MFGNPYDWSIILSLIVWCRNSQIIIWLITFFYYTRKLADSYNLALYVKVVKKLRYLWSRCRRVRARTSAPARHLSRQTRDHRSNNNNHYDWCRFVRRIVYALRRNVQSISLSHHCAHSIDQYFYNNVYQEVSGLLQRLLSYRVFKILINVFYDCFQFSLNKTIPLFSLDWVS